MRIIIEIDEKSPRIETQTEEDEVVMQLDGGTPAADLLADLDDAEMDVADDGEDVGGPPDWLVAAVESAEADDAASDGAYADDSGEDFADGGAAPDSDDD